MRKYGYEQSTFDVQGRLVDVDQYSTSFMADKAVGYMKRFERSDTKPWLMFVEPWAPHKPSTPAKKYATAKVPAFKPNPATEEANRRDKPAYVQKKQANKEKTLNLRGNMLRTLYSVNDMVKQLMRKLRRLDERNTIVFYLSDNGFQWYEHKLEAKRYPYEASVRIPMFVRWPGHLPSGDRRFNIVGNIDVAPTIYDLTGITPAYTVDGRSMMGSDRRNLLIEYWHERHEGSPPTYKALWNPKWTYVEYQDVSSKDRLEYYGPDDPWQLHNLFGNSKKGDEPSNRRRLAHRLDRLASCAGASC